MDCLIECLIDCFNGAIFECSAMEDLTTKNTLTVDSYNLSLKNIYFSPFSTLLKQKEFVSCQI